MKVHLIIAKSRNRDYFIHWNTPGKENKIKRKTWSYLYIDTKTNDVIGTESRTVVPSIWGEYGKEKGLCSLNAKIKFDGARSPAGLLHSMRTIDNNPCTQQC